MRLTIPEQAIIKCICNAKCAATLPHIVVHTGLSFSIVDQWLGKMVATGQLVMQADSGFALTKLTTCNPVVRLMQQEMVEERLWVEGAHQVHFSIVNRLFSIIHYFLQLPVRNVQ